MADNEECQPDGSSASESSQEADCPEEAVRPEARFAGKGGLNPKSLAGSTVHLPTKLLTISYSNSKACKCCLCGSMSTDRNPLVQEADEAATLGLKRPWAKYRKVVLPDTREAVRVSEGRCCLPCLNVFAS